MRKIVRVFGAFGLLALLLGVVLFGISHFRNRGAGIFIETTPSASVFINDTQVGRTPYRGIFDPGEVTVKLIPDTFEKPLAPYETRTTLTSDVQTVLVREFGETEDLSSGVIISYEKIGDGETGISVISTPDGAEVSLDGDIKGFTPFKTSTVKTGEHKLLLKAPNFAEKSLNVVTSLGYRLTAVFKLLPQDVLPAKTEEPVVIEEPKEMEQVLILDTGTGFLRVRATASTAATEIGRVIPGNKYTLVEKDQTTGWFKIQYETGKEGWVTNQFAKVVVADSSPSPTATAKPTPTAKATTKPTATPLR